MGQEAPPPPNQRRQILQFRTESPRSGSAERAREHPNKRIIGLSPHRARLSGAASPQTLRIILIELIFNTQSRARPQRVTSRPIRGAAREAGLFKTSVILKERSSRGEDGKKRVTMTGFY